MARDDPKQQLVCLGEITGAFGIRGEVRLRSFAEPPANVTAYGPLVREAGGAPVVITALRPIKSGFAARIDGVATRTEAEAMRGTKLQVPRSLLPPPDDGEFYHVDLVGLVARDEDGKRIGTVTAVLNFGAGDILEIARAEDGDRVLAPFTEEVVPVVDIAGGAIVIRPPAEWTSGKARDKDIKEQDQGK